MGDASGHGAPQIPKVSEAVKNLGYAPTPKVEGEWAVDKVLEKIPNGPPLTENSTSPVPFFHILERLKTTKREGWRRFGITNCESIADHMYRMSLLTLVAPPALASKLDMARCMKMCLIHDMAESMVGDITPVDDVPKPEKSRREAATMDYISQRLLGSVHDGEPGKQIRAIWQEYEDSKTPESIFVHDLDKMELLLQMYEYEKRSGEETLDLGEFAYVATKIRHPEVTAWADQVLEDRKAFWGEKKHVTGEAPDGGVSPVVKKQQDDYYANE